MEGTFDSRKREELASMAEQRLEVERLAHGWLSACILADVSRRLPDARRAARCRFAGLALLVGAWPDVSGQTCVPQHTGDVAAFGLEHPGSHAGVGRPLRRGSTSVVTARGQRPRRRGAAAVEGYFVGSVRGRDGQGVLALRTPERLRTPGPAAGCNRPASAESEQAVVVGKNHVDGTGPSGAGQPDSQGRSPACRVGVDDSAGARWRGDETDDERGRRQPVSVWVAWAVRVDI